MNEFKPISPLIKLKLTIAYDGTAYQGWQTQKIGLGVQQKIEEAFGCIFQKEFRLHSSSRTDTGVHAVGMVAHVEIPREQFRMTPEKLALALNAHLPEDIRILSASRCSPDFHARFQAGGKQYRYYVWNHFAMNPLLRQTAWHVPRKLDLKAVRSAAALLKGTHDFRSFAANRSYPYKSTVRTVSRLDVKSSGHRIEFIIEGDGFLYKMCRGIVGTLVQIGLGRISATEILNIMSSRDRRVAGMTAPAHGLILWKVLYPKRALEEKKDEESSDDLE